MLRFLRPVLNSTPKQWIRSTARHLTGKAWLSPLQILKLRRTPRFQDASVPFLDGTLRIVDSLSFLFMYEELFHQEIYRFRTEGRPYILDCGSNIGLSILYFKRLFPDAEVVGFEPDARIFAALSANVSAYRLADVTLMPKAVWSSETTLVFHAEGADGGRVSEGTDGGTRIETLRLRDYLVRPIDFLKIDIEGAELEVLRDCRDRLDKVKRLFVEFHSFSDRKQDLESLLECLASAGFRYYVQTTGTESKQPFISRYESAGMDMQLNIYAYRP